MSSGQSSAASAPTTASAPPATSWLPLIVVVLTQIQASFAVNALTVSMAGITTDLDTAAAAGSHVADTVIGVALAVVVGLAGSWWQRSWRPLVHFTVLVGGYLALYVIVTHLVPRDRPPVEILDPGLVPDHSFPSGHVATSIVVYVGIVLWVAAVAPRWRRWVWPLLLAPLVVAPSRLYQGAHHPTDVMASLISATIWVVVVTRVLLLRTADDRGEARSAMVEA